MQHGPETDVERIGVAARDKAGTARLQVPLLAIHGEGDRVVATSNTTALVRQYLALNGFPAAVELPTPTIEQQRTLADGRRETIREWKRDGQLVARHVSISGLGHAWSGGDATLAYNDAGAPDATALVGAFLADGLS